MSQPATNDLLSSLDLRYAVNADQCACRIVDGEAILIHAETTFYYGLNASATAIWQLLMDNDLTAREIAELMATHAELDGDELVGPIAGLLSDLHDEQLVTEAPAIEATTLPPITPLLDRGDWSDPELTRYSSLEDLIVCGE